LRTVFDRKRGYVLGEAKQPGGFAMETRNVHVYVFDTMADWEVGHAIGYINQPDYQTHPGRYRVRSVGPSLEPVSTLGGLKIVPEMTLADLKPADSAMLILPGGSGWDRGENRDAAEKARAFLSSGVPVAAICGATAGLARVGLLNDRAHTSNAKAYLEHTVPEYRGSASYREDRCVRDRGLITAGSTACVDFARTVFETLEMYPKPVLDAWHGLFSTGDPKYFYALMQASGSSGGA
jgi:putative intracellular protease/amidase